VLASLDWPFLVERPDELRDLIAAFADRLAAAARGNRSAELYPTTIPERMGRQVMILDGGLPLSVADPRSLLGP
jgi:hypothetical protein